MSGTGDSLQAQIHDAVRKASQDRRFRSQLVSAAASTTTIELWIQYASELVSFKDRAKHFNLDLGVQGVEIELHGKTAYYKPSVPLTKHIRSSERLLRKLCIKAGLARNDWQRPDAVVRKTLWVHTCYNASGHPVLLRSLRAFTTSSPSLRDLDNVLVSCSGYLLANQVFSGGFAYKYLPLANVDKLEKPNSVRTAGVAYALALVAPPNGGDRAAELRRAAKRSVDAIMLRATELTANSIYIREKDNPNDAGGKLGTSALLLLAMSTPVLKPFYLPTMNKLAVALASNQQTNGLFDCTFGSVPKTSSQINFFPGQALLALLVTTEKGVTHYQDVIERAFKPYRAHFRTAPSTAFVGWQVDVWSRAAIAFGSSEYASFAFEQVDWILAHQRVDDREVLEYGGFAKNGQKPNYSSIVYTEAVARGALLARRIGDKRLQKYIDALLAGLVYCLHLSIGTDSVAFLPFPERAIGGVTASVTDFEVRSDYVQHMITLLHVSKQVFTECGIGLVDG